MASWLLQSAVGAKVQSTLEQIREITTDFVDDMMIPPTDKNARRTESPETQNQLREQIRSLQGEVDALKDTLWRSDEHECTATICHLLDQVSTENEPCKSHQWSNVVFRKERSVALEMASLEMRVDSLLGQLRLMHDTARAIKEESDSLKVLNLADAALVPFASPPSTNPFSELLNSVRSLALDNQMMLEKTSTLQSQNSFLSEEVNRLKAHLVDMNDSHNKELMLFVERFQDCEQQLAYAREENKNLQDKIDTSSLEIASATWELDKLRVSASAQHEVDMRKLKDQSQISSNLQSALFQLHEEKRGLLTSIKKIRKQEEAIRDKASGNATNISQQEQLVIDEGSTDHSYSGNSSSAKSIQQLKRQIQSLNIEVGMKEQERMALEQTLRNISPTIGNRIEKSLVRELLMSFWRIPSNKRCEAIAPLARVLDFTPDQMEYIMDCFKGDQGWFSLRYARVNPSPNVTIDETRGPSLAELLVRYVDKETRPDLNVKFQTTAPEDPRE